jgi:hypothetical protein
MIVLPRDFTLELPDHKVMRLDLDQLERFRFSWQILCAELCRQGYTIHEYRDEAAQCAKAHCFIPEPFVSP